MLNVLNGFFLLWKISEFTLYKLLSNRYVYALIYIEFIYCVLILLSDSVIPPI